MKTALLLLMAYGFVFSEAEQKVSRVEPINWWVGMANPNLQLMIYGDNLKHLEITIDHPGVLLKKAHYVDNANYVFVDLEISESAKAGEIPLQFWSDEQMVASVSYPLLSRAPNSAARDGFSNKDVIYLITPDRFVNGDLSNDEVPQMSEGISRDKPGGRHGGDLQGIINKLDYIADMGFTQLWLNPVLENAMETYSYHGYSTTDYYAVDPRYGDNELYKSLSEQANAKGIGLIMDVILNHIGSNHWWMKDMPMKDWTNHQGKFVGTTHLREALHDPNAAEIDRRGFDDGWFVPTMPDLNQRNAFVANYLIQNSIWWVEYANLSGIRVDTYSYPDKQFLSQWTKRVMAEYPSLNIVGEEWSLNPAITAYWQRGSKRHDDYESELPSVFDFSLQHAVIKSLTETEKWNSGWITTYQSLANDFLYGDPSNLVTFPDNHDMTRVYDLLKQDPELTRMALALFATTRGIPQIYYGTEILMAGADDHGIIRSDFPGGWPGDQKNGFTGKGLTEQQQLTQSFVRKLLNFRKQEPLLHQGKLMHFGPRDGVYVYFRYLPDSSARIMVIMNKNQDEYALDLARFQEILPLAKYRAVNVLEDSASAVTDTIIVDGKKATILKLTEF